MSALSARPNSFTDHVPHSMEAKALGIGGLLLRSGVVHWFLLVVCLCCLPHSLGFAATKVMKTEMLLRRAQKALRKGAYASWRRYVHAAQSQFHWEKHKMKGPLRQHILLSLLLHSSKLHQHDSPLPKYRALHTFRSRSKLFFCIQKHRRTLKGLQRSLNLLQTYRRVYWQLVQKVQTRSHRSVQVLMLQRGLLRAIRIVQKRIRLYQYAYNHWSKRTTLNRSLQLSQYLLQEGGMKNVSKATLRQLQIRAQEKKLALALGRLLSDYQSKQLQLEQKKRMSQSLLWTGVSLLSLGATGLIASAVLVGRAEDVTIDGSTAQTLHNVGLPMAGGGGGLVLLGVSLAVAGAVVHPNLTDHQKALVYSHNRYLDYETRSYRLLSLQ